MVYLDPQKVTRLYGIRFKSSPRIRDKDLRYKTKITRWIITIQYKNIV